jgi:hypothetical protein
MNPESGKSAFQTAMNLAIWRAFEANNIVFGKIEVPKEV